MGTFHLIGSAKVRIVYPGNVRTCGRCNGAPTSCPGGGLARVCGERGGERVTLVTHMRHLWGIIKFDPGSDPVDDEETQEEEQIPDLQQLSEEGSNLILKQTLSW